MYPKGIFSPKALYLKIEGVDVRGKPQMRKVWSIKVLVRVLLPMNF